MIIAEGSGWPADAREVAAVIASPYVTGASWLVDGGMSQMGPIANQSTRDTAWRDWLP